MVDIGLLSYGRLSFLRQCIRSVKEQTKSPYSLYVANCYCPEEPEIEEYLIDLWKRKVVKGVILIKGNIYSCGYDLLYEHFLKSDPFVVSDADVVLPKVDYCWLEYISSALRGDSNMAFVSVRLSICNAGETDEDVFRRTGFYHTRAKAIKSHDTYNGTHPSFKRIGLHKATGVSFMTFNRYWYNKYLRHFKRFGCDSRLRQYFNREHVKWGALLDDCIHLGWQVEDEYPYYVEHKNVMRRERPSCWVQHYPNVEYEVFTQDETVWRAKT